MEGQIQSSKKRVRDELDDRAELAEVKRLREDLLGVLDDSDPDSVSQDLDSVMWSFDEELLSAPSTYISSPAAVIDLASDHDESTTSQLGYLLEASDDELGLPPSSSALIDDVTESVRVSSDSSGIGDCFWRFESFNNQILSHDSFDFGGVGEAGDSEYVAFDDRLFGFSDECFDSSEVSGFYWRSETPVPQ